MAVCLPPGPRRLKTSKVDQICTRKAQVQPLRQIPSFSFRINFSRGFMAQTGKFLFPPLPQTIVALITEPELSSSLWLDRDR